MRTKSLTAGFNYEVLEGRRLMSASELGVHLAPAEIAGKVFSFAPQPTTHSSLAAAASSHTKGVPVLNSRPGAAYTVYLDFAGFDYVGDWNGRLADGETTVPGFTPAFNDASPTGTFTAAEKKAITTVWARMAQSYSNLDVNITTVDPAPAGSSDTARRDFYDAKPNFIHMVFGSSTRAAYVTADNPSGNWLPGADGVSPGIGVASGKVDGPNAKQGQHTAFMFTQGHADNGGAISNFDAEYVGGIGAHENAHAFGLFHQGDYSGGGVNHINEYSFGDDRDFAFQAGTYVPIIGDANSAQRITWRIGTDDEFNESTGKYTVVNDLQRLIYKSSATYATAQGRTGAVDLHFIDDGIGNTLGTATPLALTGGSVNASVANGVIVPKSESNPVAMGASNYTTDYFSFYTDGVGQIKLSVTDSTSFLSAGVADGAGTLNSSLYIFKADGTLVGSSTEDSTTLIDTYTGTLAGGTYFAAVGSRGGHQQVNDPANHDGVVYDPAYYFDTGAFFLSGTGFDVPPVNPGTTGTISGVLWNDTNSNGIFDSSESVTGARKVFLDADGDGILDSGEKSTMSNDMGKYTFTNVPTGAAKVTRVFPAGYSLSNASAGTNGKDVIVNVTANATAVANLGTTNGSTPPFKAVVTGTLWNDSNANGIFDANESASGVRTVFIDLDRDGILDSNEKRTQSDANGKYSFTMVQPGTIAISRVFPSGYRLSNPSAGTNGKDVLVTLTTSGSQIANLGSRLTI